MQVRYMGDEKVRQFAWRRDPRNCRLWCRAPIYLFKGLEAAGLNIFVGGPGYGAMDPTKAPTPFWLQSSNPPFNPQKKNTFTHTLLLTKACTRYWDAISNLP